ncbi:MAG TPA: preprotein translocase subunit SecE [Mycobacterium sp.]|nr:preprotein translocase subunit SecE [Mycobacterium sp.]
MSDERDGAGSPVDDIDSDVDDVDSVDDDIDSVGDDIGVAGTRSQTAVATRPQRPTGKRSRRETTGGDTPAAETSSVKNGDGKKPKTAKKPGESRSNPFAFVWNFLKQVVAELRKVIWPNRKQMISYTIVVLVFLVFMVALIGGVDLGLAKLVTLVFG